jgi:hypothetical protein
MAISGIVSPIVCDADKHRRTSGTVQLFFALYHPHIPGTAVATGMLEGPEKAWCQGPESNRHAVISGGGF